MAIFDFMFCVDNCASESDMEVEETQGAASPLDKVADQAESDPTDGIAGQSDKAQGAASPKTE